MTTPSRNEPDNLAAAALLAPTVSRAWLEGAHARHPLATIAGLWLLRIGQSDREYRRTELEGIAQHLNVTVATARKYQRAAAVSSETPPPASPTAETVPPPARTHRHASHPYPHRIERSHAW